jgi:hypothetical protein
MFTDILIGFVSILGGGLVALLPYLAWSYWMRAYKGETVARPGLRWLFLVWGGLWISQGIRYSIDAMR